MVPLHADEAGAHPRGPSSKSIEIGPHLMGPTDAPPRSTSSAAGAVALSMDGRTTPIDEEPTVAIDSILVVWVQLNGGGEGTKALKKPNQAARDR